MRQAILHFPKQFSWKPELVGNFEHASSQKYIVVGMGGSHLAADILRMTHPHIPLIVHTNYGLPGPWPPVAAGLGHLQVASGLPAGYSHDAAKPLVILSSYSGNTEEVLHAFSEAQKQQLPSVVVAKGGKLLELAHTHDVPYVELPDFGIQPRMAVGLSVRALLKIMGDDDSLLTLEGLGDILQAEHFEKEGKELTHALHGRTPVVYASHENYPISYNWKIKLNETGKIPAFCNMVPELNHNEMTGFSNPDLAKQFYFIFLRDGADHPRISKRMEILEAMLNQKGAEVNVVDISHKNVWHKIFGALLLADWTAYYTAERLGHDPEQVPMVEEFKNLLL